MMLYYIGHLLFTASIAMLFCRFVVERKPMPWSGYALVAGTSVCIPAVLFAVWA